MQLRRNPAFVRFWAASSVSDFGTYLTTVALSVLILVTMDGTALDQGLVNAARWLPYLLFGLLAGIWVDRFRRRTVMITGDLGRATILAVLCLLGATGVIGLPALLILMFAFGTLALMSDAAYQSFLPQLVPRSQLVRANARLQQSETVAQTSGGAVAGGIVALLSAPFALLLDAASYLFSGLTLLTVPAGDRPARSTTPVRTRIAEGLRWIYGHRMLRPLALSSHLWFIGSAMLGAVLPALILNDLRLGALGLGLVLGGAGIGAVIGTTLSQRWGERWGTGRVVVAARLAQPPAVVVVLLAPLAAGGATGDGSMGSWPAPVWAAFALAVLGQVLYGCALGAEGPVEMGYWQAVTPDALIARMNATRRSVNRGMIVVGAPLGGVIATGFGSVAALGVAAAVMLVSALVLALSPFRVASDADFPVEASH
ncbi:MFS family permease [Arthrobacter pigmenti]|uniref:MFS family permease n=1 Tax=Arthrobacter pigmenti TaxID=271432 RepID=A0A846RL02_9MICC|nr:MFS transporter [Arthrobacter pigmenti]NJC20944.1 MFS family permease [Arthrobacter pigmenti]